MRRWVPFVVYWRADIAASNPRRCLLRTRKDPVGQTNDTASKDLAIPDPPLIVVGIGASAGGLEALGNFFTHLKPEMGMAFVVVQHLDPSQPSLMTELLARQTTMPVHAARNGLRLESCNVYVIAPNEVLTIQGGILKTTSPAEHSTVRTHIDTFFRSLAEDQAKRAIGVVLSGAGSDGTLGLKAIKEHGGVTIAQAPTSAKYDSMPSSAIATGLVDFTLPVEEIPAKLIEQLAYVAKRTQDPNTGAVEHGMATHLPRICEVLHKATGHNFNGYKAGTMGRRIERRLQVHHIDSVATYVARLEQDPAEARELFKDLLIGVTQFFRDPEAFEVLARRAIPKILLNKDVGAEVRIWVPGCASGEEAYSIAILFCEAVDKLKVAPHVQVLATDIDDQAIAAARLGRYPASVIEHVSPQRQERFFVRHGDAFQVTKQIRDMCVFSIHNLVRDPPFSSLDLISCRNLLIYLDTTLQKQVVPLFHYALSPGGFLLLGSSEGLGASADLFQELDEKQRLFQRKAGEPRATVLFPLSLPNQAAVQLAEPVKRPEQAKPHDVGALVEQMVLAYAPPCVVINRRAEIIYSSGETSPFLQQPTGKPTLNIIDQARKGLRAGLRMAIRDAIKTNQPVLRTNLAVKTAGELQLIDLIVRPVPGIDESSHLLAVVFQAARGKAPMQGSGSISDEAAVQQLEQELKSAREEMRSTVEALETATEDSKSSNEELLSMNEEMQSTNEELQSSKEEMQSVNEELSTVNAELHKKLEMLDLAHADLENLIRSTEIATLFLDRELRIKRFTPAATLLFRLLESDTGRPISDFAPRFTEGDVLADMTEVLHTLATKERQVYLPETQSWFLARFLPSRTVGNVIDGVIATFVDITTLKHAEDSLRQSEERARQLTDTLPAIAWTARADGATDFFNDRIRQYQGFGHNDDGTWDWTNALHPDDVEKTLQAWEQAVKTGTAFQVEHRLRTTDGQWRWHLGQAVPIRDEHGQIIKWSGTVTDIHDLRMVEEDKVRAETAKKVAERADRAKDQFLAVLSHELRTPLAPVVLALNILHDTPGLDADTRESVEIIRRNIELESRLIDDLLDVTRIANGKLELDRRPVDLATILRQTVEVCMPDIEARKLDIEVGYPEHNLFLDADPTRLQQAFWNLLRNAVKFTPLGGCVGIHCHVDGKQGMEENGFVVLEFTDTGEGIDPHMLPRLFSAFEQGGRHTTRRFGGLGLGLSICKTVINLHGGTVAAHSEGKGKGSTFVVRLPLLPAGAVSAAIGTSSAVAKAPVAASASVLPARTRLRILLVEDHGDTARIMRRLLTARGHVVEIAANVASALHLAGESDGAGGPPQEFDLLISDMGLPDGSGLDLMRELKQRKVILPAIALSGYGQEADLQQSRDAGFLEHLVKPVSIPRLEEAIARTVGSA